jgi:hypothetical protein
MNQVFPLLAVLLMVVGQSVVAGDPPDVPGLCVGLVLMPYLPDVLVPPSSDSGFVDDQQDRDWGWFMLVDGPSADGWYLYDMAGSTVNGICLGRGVPPKQS